jgi:putative FmdB family regulatory protein
MPIYEYECTKCGNVEEAVQKFSDAPLTTCRQCSGQLHKLISQSSFHLKGSGWYVTDYASNRSGNTSAKPQKEDKAVKSDSGADSSAKSAETTS